MHKVVVTYASDVVRSFSFSPFSSLLCHHPLHFPLLPFIFHRLFCFPLPQTFLRFVGFRHRSSSSPVHERVYTLRRISPSFIIITCSRKGLYSSFLCLKRFFTSPDFAIVHHHHLFTKVILQTNERIPKAKATTATGELLLWDVRSGKIVRTLETKSSVTSAEVSKDGHYITTADGSSVKFWDAYHFGLVKSYDMPCNVESASLEPKLGDKFIAGGEDMWIRLFDFNTGEENGL